MTHRRTALIEARADGLRIVHQPRFRPEWVVQAIDLHRANAARGREHCEHWGPGSSVSHVVLRAEVDLDLAVKWNHARGLRGALADSVDGSRAARAAAGAEVLAGLSMPHPETLAWAERRRFGLVRESFLITRFLADTEPLPIALAELRHDRARRRALARAVGDCLGTLHAAGHDHADLKHSNLLVGRDGRIVLLDLDTLVPRRAPTWRRVVRSLGQLEAYTVDLHPWLPRTDRTRFLAAYFARFPRFAPRRRELVARVKAWVERRLARWEGRDRTLHIYYPLAPRPTRPRTVAVARGTRVLPGASGARLGDAEPRTDP